MMKTLKELREEKGLTIEELAQEASVRVRTIKRLEEENLKVPAVEAGKLAFYFNTTKIKNIFE